MRMKSAGCAMGPGSGWNAMELPPRRSSLSARLKLARRMSDEYRRRIKTEVRELCDAGFDAFG